MMAKKSRATMNPTSNEAMSEEEDFYWADKETEVTHAKSDSVVPPFPNFYESAPTHPLSVDSIPRLPSGEFSMVNIGSSYSPPDETNSLFKPERSSSPQKESHRRGYQACQPCRQRKVKCDMGSKASDFLVALSSCTDVCHRCGQTGSTAVQEMSERAEGLLLHRDKTQAASRRRGDR